MPKPPHKLPAENVSFTIGATENFAGHQITVNFGYDPKDTRLVEIAFCEAGKVGHGLHLLLAELGLKTSRALQYRDPDTGAELEPS